MQTPPGEATANQPARIDVKIEGDSEKMVAALELGYRTGDTGAFLTTRAKPPAILAVPAPVLAPGARVDYYVRALDEHGGVVAESGTPALPFRLQVALPIVAAARAAALVPEVVVLDAVGAAAVGAGAITYVGDAAARTSW